MVHLIIIMREDVNFFNDGQGQSRIPSIIIEIRRTTVRTVTDIVGRCVYEGIFLLIEMQVGWLHYNYNYMQNYGELKLARMQRWRLLIVLKVRFS